MSTIKSSDEHLTLNADGSSKDIKFQANGVEKASISSAGAFTSTTIDATKLTGDLPAISGASLTGVADATKLPLAGGTLTGDLLIDKSANNARLTLGGGYVGQIKFENNPVVTNWMVTSQYVKSNAFEIIPSTAVGGDTFTTPVLQITSDGRGLSQFTAKAWVNFNGTGTISINDSHNISSVTDNSTGNYFANFTNNMANTNHVQTGTVGDWDVMLTTGAPNVSRFTAYVVKPSASNLMQDKDDVMMVAFGD